MVILIDIFLLGETVLSMKNIIFKGSGVAIVTPMNRDGSINYDIMKKLIEFHIENKTDAIIVCGTTGESSTLTEEEKLNLIKFTVKEVNNRVPVIGGSGSNNTERTLQFSLKVQKLGADGLLIVTPYYNKTSQTGLINHYIHIADQVNIPIILYNVPSRTGLDIDIKTYKILSEHPRIVATKEASGDISKIAQINSLCKEGLYVYSGNDDQIIPVLSLGGIGVISVFANIFPKESHEITDYYFSGNVSKSRDLFFKSLDIMNVIFKDINPMPVKSAMKWIGFDCGEVRLPLVPIIDSLDQELKRLIKDYQKNC